MAGVYLHIPFCRQKCGYCDFYSRSALPETMERYALAVTAQLRAFASAHGKLPAGTVYFGGGTPSLTGAALLTRILDTVRDCFTLSPDAEITLEANPGELCMSPGGGSDGAAFFRAVRRAGYNRLSMGVQSAHDDELRLLGRRHTFTQAAEAVQQAREAGFSNLSLDLMYALPNQTVPRWMESVRALVELHPEHLSCYALRLEEDVPLYPLAAQQPEDEIQLEMYLQMVEYLESCGYRQYEISNFAKPGLHSRHNSAYWTGEPYYGFGPGAHSFYDGARRENPADLPAYLAAAARGSFPETVLETAEERNPAEEAVLLGLRTLRGLTRAALPGFFDRIADRLSRYVLLGLVCIEPDRIFCTPRGFFVSNSLIVEALEAMDGL